jgi:hypothetical protein
MGKVGFVFLLIGGALLVVAGVSLALDAATRAMIESLINTYVAAGLGTLVSNLLYLLTSFGGVGVILGGILWFAAGQGCLARIGSFIAGVSAFGATYQVIMAVIVAYQTGVFSLPIHQILAYFAGLGIGFAAVFFVFLGLILGAGRRKVAKPTSAPPSQQTA